MLTEIEHKVASLLEHCKDQSLGDHGAIQQEAEALALKLKTVKCNLEKVQLVLQEKYSEDQVRCGCAQTCVQICGYGRPIRNELWAETLKQLQRLSKKESRLFRLQKTVALPFVIGFILLCSFPIQGVSDGIGLGWVGLIGLILLAMRSGVSLPHKGRTHFKEILWLQWTGK